MMTGLDEALITIDKGLETITPLTPLLAGLGRIRAPQANGTGKEDDMSDRKQADDMQAGRRDELAAQITRRQALETLHRKADQYMKEQQQQQQNDERKR